MDRQLKQTALPCQLGGELHALKYRASPDVLSSAASIARPAIPPPAEPGGFSRRSP